MKKKVLIGLIAVVAALFATLSFSACKAKDVISDAVGTIDGTVNELIYDAPANIAYDGQYITWNKVDLAKHYTVSINGGEAMRSNSTTYAYKSADTFEATVTAVFDDTEKSASVIFKPLATIEALSVTEDGTVSWDAVSGANAYLLSVNGNVQTVTDTAFGELPSGRNRVKVKPVVSGDNSYYSSYSKEVNIYIYAAPQAVKYDGAELTWTGNASSYAVTINGITQTVQGAKTAYNSENKDFTVEIKAIGDHSATFDSKPVTEEFNYLPAISSIFVEDGNVKWNAIDRAEGYKIKINGIEVKTTVTDTVYDKLASGKSQDVQIMPYNNSGNYFSSWSAEKTIYVLDTPVVSWNNDLELDGEANNNITWNAVNAAFGYTARMIKDGGTPIITNYSDVQRAFSDAYETVGVYTVEIKANAEAGSHDYYDSKYSAPITIERLAAPKDPVIVSDKDNVSAGFTVTFTKVGNASGYQLYKDGAIVSGKYSVNAAITDNNVTDSAKIEEQNYTYKVRSMGGIKTVGTAKYVTLPCLTRDALSFNITVQATPQSLEMSGFVLRWSAVQGNNGYTVSYAGAKQTSQAETCDLSTIKAGTYEVTVNSRGNGGAVLASNKSAPVNIVRLETPKNLKITSDAEGTLTFDKVANAKSYSAYLDLSTNALSQDKFSNFYSNIDTNGTTVSVIAVANVLDEATQIYYMSSEISPTQLFIRLAAPSFPEFAIGNGTELLWNAPANINTSEYTPTYRLFKKENEQYGGGDINGTKYNIEGFEAGAYPFLVKAIGNGTKYLDSEYSLPKTINKLETPMLSISENKYVWSGIASASSYYLEIDGKKVSDEYHVSGSSYSFIPTFATVGSHTVKLKAVGDGKNNADSGYFVRTQQVKLLSDPEISYRYSNERYVAGGEIIVEITTASQYARGYRYTVSGTDDDSAIGVDKTETTYSKVVTVGKHSISVKALGGVFVDGVYYLDSHTVGSGEDYINVLSAPNESSFRITTDGAIFWDNVTGNKGYCYQISYNDGEFGEFITLSAGRNTFTVPNISQYDKVTVKIYAKGDGRKTISSELITFVYEK